MKKAVLNCLCLLVILTIAFIGNHAQALTLPNVKRACLPEAGRMLPVYNWATGAAINPIPKCHCPPKSLCPVTHADWQTPNKMPLHISQVCCAPPLACNLMIRENNDDACPASTSFTSNPQNFCINVDYTPVDASDFPPPGMIPDPACVPAPGVTCPMVPEPDTRQDQADAENARRNGVKNSVNSCLSSCMSGVSVSSNLTQAQWNTHLNCLNSCNTEPASIQCDSNLLLRRCRSEVNRCQGDRGGGNDGGGDCFSGETLVQMADGSTKPINQIHKGDKVQAQHSINEVLEVIETKHESLLYYRLNGHLDITGEHPILTGEGWKAITPADAAKRFPERRATELKVGDVVIGHNQSFTINSIEPVDHKSAYTTYNLRLNGTKMFYANDVLVSGE